MAKDYTSIAATLLSDRPDAARERVLEIGSDSSGGLLTALAPHVGEIVGVNIIGDPEPEAPNASFVRGDARNLDFPDNSFDYAVSHAVFEHVHGFADALSEIHRVLKPGGELQTTFGPVWSCLWGHHLWVYSPKRSVAFPQGLADSARLALSGQNPRYYPEAWYRYVEPPLLPPYCHLLMEPDELRRHLRGTILGPALDHVIDFVFTSEEQNRVFADTYLNDAYASPFEVLEAHGVKNEPLAQKYLERSKPLDWYLSQLESRYGPGDYTSAAIRLRLRKPTG